MLWCGLRRGGVGCFWSVGGSNGVLGGFESEDFRASSLSACGFSALCTALPYRLVGVGLLI